MSSLHFTLTAASDCVWLGRKVEGGAGGCIILIARLQGIDEMDGVQLARGGAKEKAKKAKKLVTVMMLLMVIANDAR